MLLSNVALGWRRNSFLAPILGGCAGLVIVAMWMSGLSVSKTEMAFLYVLTGAFLLCLAAGVALLRRRISGIVLYWRYLTAVWIWLVLLFEVWR